MVHNISRALSEFEWNIINVRNSSAVCDSIFCKDVIRTFLILNVMWYVENAALLVAVVMLVHCFLTADVFCYI